MYELRRSNGSLLVLFFGGTGCPVAREAIPKVHELREAYASKGVEFWMIESTGISEPEIHKELVEFGATTLTTLLDEDQAADKH